MDAEGDAQINAGEERRGKGIETEYLQICEIVTNKITLQKNLIAGGASRRCCSLFC